MEHPPRRRVTDGTPRRRREDKLIDLLLNRQRSQGEDIEELRLELRPLIRLAGDMASFRREFDEWKSERRDDITEFRSDIAEGQRHDRSIDAKLTELSVQMAAFQAESQKAHKAIAYGKDPTDGKTPLPPQPATLTWGSVAKIATILAAFFGPTAAIVAALVTH